MRKSTKLALFDMDGTIAKSGQPLSSEMRLLLKKLYDNNYDLGIVGGGIYSKIINQLVDTSSLFEHLFSECGCVYHRHGYEIYRKNIRNHKLYPEINVLVKKALAYIANVDYELSGHFIDLRIGIIYISLIGMQATETEREMFMKKDALYRHRTKLITILKQAACDLNIVDLVDIVEGGSVGISLYPKEWDKIQVVDELQNTTIYTTVHYFGDKYKPGENDHKLLNDSYVIGHPVNSVEDTISIIHTLIEN